MRKFIHLAVAYFVTAPTILREKKELGASQTMEAVIWIGGVALLAVGMVALLSGAANGWIAKIPT